MSIVAQVKTKSYFFFQRSQYAFTAFLLFLINNNVASLIASHQIPCCFVVLKAWVTIDHMNPLNYNSFQYHFELFKHISKKKKRSVGSRSIFYLFTLMYNLLTPLVFFFGFFLIKNVNDQPAKQVISISFFFLLLLNCTIMFAALAICS